MKTYSPETFKKVYGNGKWYALLIGDKREAIVKRSVLNLHAKCDKCSNCSGIECSTITVQPKL